jgi:SAM-dependent methyltransferase
VSGAPRASYRASDGAAYARFLGRWSRWLAEPFLDFAALPAEGAMLDVGCGTGSLAAALGARFPGRPIVGVDIAEPYVAWARAQAETQAVAFAVGDAGRLCWPDGRFVGTLAQLVLNFVADPYAAAQEMRRVTRPGGVLAACVWDFRGGLVCQRLFWDTAAALDPAAGASRDRLFSHPLATPDGLLELWRGIGLAAVESRSLTIRMEYRDFADYWQPPRAARDPSARFSRGSRPTFATGCKTRCAMPISPGA